jgi:hypothetical protein
MAVHRRPRREAAHTAQTKTEEATLVIEVFREEHTATGCQKVAVPGVVVDAYLECADTPIGDSSKATTGEDQQIEITVPLGSVVRLVPRFADADAPRMLYTPAACGVVVVADRDRTCPIPFQYHCSPAEVWASASVCAHHDGQAPTQTSEPTPPTEPVFLPNVTFRLHQGIGLASEVLKSHTTTRDCHEVHFPDLSPGYYTLRADLPNQGAFKPCCTTRVFHVCEGQSLDLGCCFCFKPVTNNVLATVADKCGNLLPDVHLLLVGSQGHCQKATGPMGTVTFPGVKVGTYTLHLLGGQYIGPDGTTWVVAMPEPTVHVVAGPTPTTGTLVLQPDILRIDIDVTDPHGRSQPNAVVEIYDASRKKVIDTVVLDDNGKTTWIAPADEMYYFALKPSSGGAPARLFAASDESGS